jgi:PBP1b-binding outer membrane lipoprotein LpoB
MKKFAAALIIASLLVGCGGRVKLKPKEGQSMPGKAEAAPAPPTVDELLTPSTQAQPKRSDEQLKRSEERREDKFDLPPSEA